MHENWEIFAVSQSNRKRDRSGQAPSRTTDIHAAEKSDHAVLPMNQPNNGEQSWAEVGEGSAWAKENIVQSNKSPT